MTLIINRPNITSFNILKNELQVEFINMSIYASDKVLIAMKDFITNQDQEALNKLAMALRKDLYGIRTSLLANHFNLDV